jgi:hypothetical protein
MIDEGHDYDHGCSRRRAGGRLLAGAAAFSSFLNPTPILKKRHFWPMKN